MVTRVAVQDVGAVEFIAQSRASKEALRSANLLKSIGVNALIVGERGTGKRTLASQIVQAPVIDANIPFEKLENLLLEQESLIVTDFEKMRDIERFQRLLEIHPTRIVATAQTLLSIDQLFSITIHLPPLRERREDISPLVEVFEEEVREALGLEPHQKIDMKTFHPDLSVNAYSLKKSVYLVMLAKTMTESELMDLLEIYLNRRIAKEEGYRELLYLFEAPLIKAGFGLYKSQLKLAEKLGLNRNTLRKKINENKEYL